MQRRPVRPQRDGARALKLQALVVRLAAVGQFLREGRQQSEHAIVDTLVANRLEHGGRMAQRRAGRRRPLRDGSSALVACELRGGTTAALRVRQPPLRTKGFDFSLIAPHEVRPQTSSAKQKGARQRFKREAEEQKACNASGKVEQREALVQPSGDPHGHCSPIVASRVQSLHAILATAFVARGCLLVALRRSPQPGACYQRRPQRSTLGRAARFSSPRVALPEHSCQAWSPSPWETSRSVPP